MRVGVPTNPGVRFINGNVVMAGTTQGSLDGARYKGNYEAYVLKVESDSGAVVGGLP